MIEEEGLADNAAKMGEVFMRELTGFRPDIVSTVRGRGLLLAMEIKNEGGMLKGGKSRHTFKMYNMTILLVQVLFCVFMLVTVVDTHFVVVFSFQRLTPGM